MKKLMVMVVLLSGLLVGCQANEVKVNPEENVETSVTAADYFEYVLFDTVAVNHITLSDDCEYRSDSKSLVITIPFENVVEKPKDAYQKWVTSVQVDAALSIIEETKELLVKAGYSQDVYIEYTDNNGKVQLVVDKNTEPIVYIAEEKEEVKKEFDSELFISYIEEFGEVTISSNIEIAVIKVLPKIEELVLLTDSPEENALVADMQLFDKFKTTDSLLWMAQDLDELYWKYNDERIRFTWTVLSDEYYFRTGM